MGDVVSQGSFFKSGESDTSWLVAMIPLYMAIGNPGLLVTLVALANSASVAQVGAISAAGSTASFILSMVWGRLSDISSRRKIYLMFFSLMLIPLFVELSLTNGLPQITLLYTLIIALSSGVAPIAVMYTVECCRGKNWPSEVARLNSIMSMGNLAGLFTFTLAAGYFTTQNLFYISAAVCFTSFLLLWRLGKEPEITLERHPFSRILHDIGDLLSPKPLLQILDVRRLTFPRSLKKLSLIQLLLITAFIHWTGINIFIVGMTPLMKALGLSDSLILALNVGTGLATAASFIWIAPHAKIGPQHLKKLITARALLVLCWAPLPIFIASPPSYVFIFPFLILAAINICYAMLWLPLSSFAILQAPEDRKSSVVGQLMSSTAIAGAIGSAIGGLIITAYGYIVGFVIASIIMFLATQTVTKITTQDMVDI